MAITVINAHDVLHNVSSGTMQISSNSTLVANIGVSISIGKTSMTPAGAPGPTLNGWQWSSVPGPWWAELMRPINNDPISPFNAAMQAYIIATWGAGEHLDISWYGDFTQSGGNTFYGMPINQVAGTTPLQSMTYTTYAAQADLGPVPYGPSTTIEAWPTGSGDDQQYVVGTIQVVNGSPNVVGTSTSFISQVSVGGQYIFYLYGSPSQSSVYTVLSISNDTHLVLTANYAETSASGLAMFGPYNLPPTLAQQPSGDTRILALMRNESTGLPATLYEDYFPTSEDGGTTWLSAGGAKFNLDTGAQRLDGNTSTTAGGTPCMPFLVRYEEANSGVINHTLRGIIGSSLNSNNTCIWPAIHGVSGAIGDYTQGLLTMGARLRLNADWLAANISGFSPINQSILTAMNQYGMHVDDLTGGPPIWIDGTQDSRWNHADLLNLLTVPVTALEVIDTIKPQYTFTAPASGTTGVALTFTLTYVGGDNTNFGNSPNDFNNYIEWSTDGTNWNIIGNVNLTNATPGPLTFSWTPTISNNYWMQTHQSSVAWINPPYLSIAVSVVSRNMTSIADGRWDLWDTWGAAPPTAGDAAIVAHNIIMVGSTILGTGAATTCLTITTGSLSVIGCTLTLRGNALIGPQVGPGGTVVNYLTTWSSAGNQAGIIFDGNSSITPFMSVGVASQITFTGTSGCHSFCTTKNGSAGNSGYITDCGSSAHQTFYMVATYCDFSNLGGASQAGLISHLMSAVTNTPNPLFVMDHCAVDNCGIFPNLGIIDGSIYVSITNSTWTNCLGTTAQNFADDGSSITSGGARILDGCTFFNAANWAHQAEWIITNNYFDDPIQAPFFGGFNALAWSLFDGNFIVQRVSAETGGGGSVTNCYMYNTTSLRVDGIFANRNAATSTYSYSVLESDTTDGSGFLFSETEWAGITSGRILTYSHNITLPSTAGGGISSGNVMFTSNITSDGSNAPYAVIEHNTAYVGDFGGIVSGGGSAYTLPGHITSIRSNAFWSDANHGGYGIISGNPAQLAAPDSVSYANCDYNGSYNVATVPGGTFASPNNLSNGTIYDIPLSTGIPGAHDIGQNPQWVDSTRNIRSWAVVQSYVSSGASAPTKFAAALAAIQANPSLTNSSLLPYIRAGFTPTNSSYIGTGHNASGADGLNIGAV